MPLHALALGHVSEKEVRGGRKAMVALSGDKVAPDLPRLTTACGWLVSREVDGRIARYCIFQGASDIAITKWVSGLQPVEPVPVDPGEGGPADWIASILNAGQASQKQGLGEARDVDQAVALDHARKSAEESRAAAEKRRASGKKRGWLSGGSDGDAPEAGRGVRAALVAGGGAEQPAVEGGSTEAPAVPKGRVKRADLK